MRHDSTRNALALNLGVGILSSKATPTSTRSPQGNVAAVSEDFAAQSSAPQVRISQVYGGGGNSGATIKNDFIELFNPGTLPVDLTGWSVQYASAAGSSWQVTPLSGSIPPGRYYLVKEAAGSGGTTELPPPDATGAIPMALGAGKVWLVGTTTPLSGTCPTGAVDQVSYGSTATNCGFHTTATLTNTTAAVRGDSGCAYTGDLSVDFTTRAPGPRNSSSPTHLCEALPLGPLDHVTISGPATV